MSLCLNETVRWSRIYYCALQWEPSREYHAKISNHGNEEKTLQYEHGISGIGIRSEVLR